MYAVIDNKTAIIKEQYDTCANGLDEQYSDMGMADETPDDVLHSVCDPSWPALSLHPPDRCF